MSKKFLIAMRGEGFDLKAKNRRRQAKTACGQQANTASRVDRAVSLAFSLPDRTLTNISRTPCKGNRTIHTVRAKEKIKRGCRELIRI